MNKDLFDYLKESTTAFGAVAATAGRLEKAGFERVYEKDHWHIVPGDKKYVVRNDSSLIAFCIPKKDPTGFSVIAAHGDSPCFKLKENPGIVVEDSYLKLNVEAYGGMRKETWLDRPLSVAGRIVVVAQNSKQPETILVDFKRPLFIIPSLAVHMTNGKEQEKELNIQLHLLPLAGTITEKDAFEKALAQEVKVPAEDILGMDLYLYPVAEPVVMGINEELLGAPRLDDLACAWCGLQGITEETDSDKISVFALFDNEEVGSMTMQGANSNFLVSVLERIADAGGKELACLLAESFLLSADNAHGLHPNYTEKGDPTNRPKLNQGIVIKYHGSQKYTTSAYSGAFVKMICREKEIPFQTYHNRSDIAGGSTLGNIALAKVSVPAADIGIPQLAMHSAFETAGIKDIESLSCFMKAFYET